MVFGAVAGPAYLFGLTDGPCAALVGSGTVLAVVVFFVRVASVLVRFARGGQPSQPGRTSPDS